MVFDTVRDFWDKHFKIISTTFIGGLMAAVPLYYGDYLMGMIIWVGLTSFLYMLLCEAEKIVREG